MRALLLLALCAGSPAPSPVEFPTVVPLLLRDADHAQHPNRPPPVCSLLLPAFRPAPLPALPLPPAIFRSPAAPRPAAGVGWAPPFPVLARFSGESSVDTQFNAPTAWCFAPRAYRQFTRYRHGQRMIAHRSLPLGSLVLVIRHGNPLRVEGAIVTDRGPYCGARVVDASDVIGARLGLEDDDPYHIVSVWVLRRGPGEGPGQDYALLNRAAHWLRSR